MVLLALIAPGAAAAQRAVVTAADLRADLAQLRTHVTTGEESYSATARAQAIARVDAMARAIGTLSARYFEFEVARIIALADNGHSNSGIARASPPSDAPSLTRRAAAELLGVSPPDVSDLVRGKLARFSYERLIRFLVRSGANVAIVVSPPKTRRRDARLSVVLR